VSFVDLAPTLLSIAGVQPPDWMQGFAFAGKYQTEPQPYVYGFRGRMDERYDFVRSVTDGRFVYVRNYMPHLSQGQHVAYQFETPTTAIWRSLFDQGKTNAEQSIFWNEMKASEELYDLQSDRDEVHNLADKPEHEATLAKMRKAQEALALRIRDTDFLPEGEIHSRSEGSTPYDIAHDDKAYPLERIMAAASAASSLKAEDVPALKKAVSDPDSAVRYWATMGLRMRDQSALNASHDELLKALHDSSTYVQTAAAWTLAKHGSDDDLHKALPALLTLADWSKHNVFTAMAALNAIGDLGKMAAPIAEQLKSLPRQGAAPDGRFKEYVPRLLRDLTGDAGDAPTNKAKKGKNAR
jgi:uncharacterized sulfatase